MNCSLELTSQEAQLFRACPACGTTVAPCDTKQDILLHINWKEVEILALAAQLWYKLLDDTEDRQARQTLAAILARLDAERPEGGEAITLKEQIADLFKETSSDFLS